MIYVEADNIISPLGTTAEENYQAVRQGGSALRTYTDPRGLMEPYAASIFTDKQRTDITSSVPAALSFFEALATMSAQKALANTNINPAAERTILIISTTKGDLEHSLGDSAKRIADGIGVKTQPVVVCNACISGLAAIILALRMLEDGYCDNAIVCGADSPEEFIISGFQSLKALSAAPCRPFDMERTGLNLGQAAATLVLSNTQTKESQWAIEKGSVRNDAFHITQPARKGDGLLACIEDILPQTNSEIALVNVHGTATLFNDQMESQALQRAGLSEVPVNALKGYFGHTMGAAGILETIITMRSLDDHIILGTRGLEELGVSGKIQMSAKQQPTDKATFIKILSGFGGCNAAIRASKFSEQASKAENKVRQHATHSVHITPAGAVVDGNKIEAEGEALISGLYKKYVNDYPKFYKMDALSRLGFITSELLISAEGKPRFDKCENRAIIFFNRTSSIVSDKKYKASITSPSEYFPSPSVFVYTLPNIVTGEIAIRNNYHGETSFYILSEKNETLQQDIVQASLAGSGAKSAITGWLDYQDENNFEADLYIIETE